MGKKILCVYIIFNIFIIFFLGSPLSAQHFPSQPIQMIITLAPGDGLDLTGRAIASEL